MKTKKTFTIMLSIFFILTTPGMVHASENDIYYKIDQLYSAEENPYLKEIQTKSLKALINPGSESDVTDAQYICSVPYDETIAYALHTIGFDRSWPRYRTENEKLLIYMPIHTDSNVDQYKNDINKIYAYVNEIKEATINMSTEAKITYIQNLLSQKLSYDDSADFSYKLNDVLKTNKAVCTGYSGWFYLLCINLGIKCECVGTREHMFNRVWINNQWNYIDTTWNDAMGKNVWFLLNESQLDQLHKLDDYFKIK